MKSWPLVKLCEVADQCLGKMLDAKKNKGEPKPYLRNPNVRWFEIDLTDLRTMPFEEHESERFGLKAGDIVICEGGEAGRAAIWDGRIPDLRFQKAIHRVRPKERLHNRFFVHRLYADFSSGKLADYYTGATIKHFTGQDLARYEFPLPPLAEQKRIAGILDAADALRAKRRAALAQLDALAQSLFLDLFGDPVTNPKGWEVVTLERAATRITDGTHQSPKWSEDGIPFLFVSNVRDRKIDFSTSKFISEEEFHHLTARCPVEIGDILYTTVGSYGNPAMVRAGMVRFAFQRHIAHIKPKSELIDSQFLEVMLDSSVVRNQADKLVRGVAQKTLNLRELKSFKILLPPLPLQQQFAAAVEAIERQKARHREQLAGLDALFASLHHRAFRGEL